MDGISIIKQKKKKKKHSKEQLARQHKKRAGRTVHSVQHFKTLILLPSLAFHQMRRTQT
jgi:hypothetical protein